MCWGQVQVTFIPCEALGASVSSWKMKVTVPVTLWLVWSHEENIIVKKPSKWKLSAPVTQLLSLTEGSGVWDMKWPEGWAVRGSCDYPEVRCRRHGLHSRDLTKWEPWLCHWPCGDPRPQLNLFSNCSVCWVTLAMSDSVTPWAVTQQAPLSLRISRQEYWSGLPFPPPRDLAYPGTEPMSLMSPA